MPFLRFLEIITNSITNDKSQRQFPLLDASLESLQSLGLKNSFRLFGNIELLDDNLQLVVVELIGSLDLEVDDGKFLSGVAKQNLILMLINYLDFEPWGGSLPAGKTPITNPK